MIKLFQSLDIETSSMCNRVCAGCIRNSNPNRQKVSDWFKESYLSVDTIANAVEQCVLLGFSGDVCLSHYNEPLLDDRVVEISKYVRQFFPVYLHTNGDWLNENLANSLDGVLDKIVVSLYFDTPYRDKRAELIRSWFKKTKAVVNTDTKLVPTHFSPLYDVKKLSKLYETNPCHDPSLHCIINHRGQYLACCDDMVGNFDFGSFPEVSIKDYWFSEKHIDFVESLKIGCRTEYDYCLSCPR